MKRLPRLLARSCSGFAGDQAARIEVAQTHVAHPQPRFVDRLLSPSRLRQPRRGRRAAHSRNGTHHPEPGRSQSILTIGNTSSANPMETHSSSRHIEMVSEKPAGLQKVRTALIVQGIMVALCALVLICFLFFHSTQYEDYMVPAAVSFCVGIGLLMGLLNLLFLFFWLRWAIANTSRNKN